MRMNMFSTMATMVAKVIGAITCSTEVPAKREVSAGTDCSRMPAPAESPITRARRGDNMRDSASSAPETMK